MNSKFHRLSIIFILCIVLLYVGSRFYKLSAVPAWEDNFSWLYRINYYPWIIETNFKGYPEPGKDLSYAGRLSYHPGVTLMTFSGLTTRYGKKLLHKIDPNYIPCNYNDYACEYLGVELFLAKIPIILFSSVCLFFILRILSMKLGWLATLIFTIILFFEPILYSTSRDLHLDYLQSIFITTSFVLFSYTNKVYNKIISGVLFGLATLTRFVTVSFIPAFILVELLNKEFNYKKVINVFIAGFLTFFILYPPMWVAPIKTLEYIYSGSVGSSNSHTNLAELSFFHPQNFNLSILWVSSFIVSTFYYFFNFRKLGTKYSKVLVFFTVYFIALTFSSKKFFRYLTPVIMGYSIYISGVLVELFESVLLVRFSPDDRDKVHAKP